MLEQLEDRTCPSVFYDVELLASYARAPFGPYLPPMVNSAGDVSFWVRDEGTYSSSGGEVSQVFADTIAPHEMNDAGEFVGFASGFAETGGIFVRDLATGADRPIAIQAPSRHNPDPLSPPNLFENFSGTVSINNHGAVAFIAQPRIYNEDGIFDPTLPFKLYVSATLVSAMEDGPIIGGNPEDQPQRVEVHLADNGHALVFLPTFDDGGSGGKLYLYDNSGGRTTIADTTNRNEWRRLTDAVSISDDGAVIVFSGDRGKGGGVFASVAQPDGSRALIRVAGESDSDGDGEITPFDVVHPDLGYDSAGKPIYFVIESSFPYANPVVTTFANPSGLPDSIDPGESFVVSFIARPNRASAPNPLTGAPLLFSEHEGIWSTLVRAESPPGTSGAADYLLSSAHKVLQQHDAVAGVPLVGFNFALRDGIATAQRGSDGTARDVMLGDHYLAIGFRAHSGHELVIRASQLDSDGDGLYDHWERHGIDIDGDGAIDLDLPGMGAQVLRKDLFLEIDWLADDKPAGHPDKHRTFRPEIVGLNVFVDTFAAAPVSNPDGTTGITVHVDAGTYLRRNMGVNDALLSGGDEIVEPGTGNHIHVLYFGEEGSIEFLGNDALGRPIVARSVEDIKRNFFGTVDKWARELAFRYVIFGDHHSDPTEFSSGLGELSAYRADSLHTIPGNDFLVTLQGASHPATLAVPPGGPVGAPASVPTPTAFHESQTLMHELGHTLGLRHGGIDHVTTSAPNWPTHVPADYRPNYLSVMNYAYQLTPKPDGTFVRSYSGPGDAVFDDWSAIQLNFNRYYENLGNTRGRWARDGSEPPPEADIPEPGLLEFEAVNGPLDRYLPTATINLAVNHSVAPGVALIVPITATDDTGVASVFAEFDANGDGEIDPDTERVEAVLIGAGLYGATFGATQGEDGPRTLNVIVTDVAGRETVATRDVTVGAASDNGPPTVNAGGPYAVDEGSSVHLTATAIDPDGDGLSYAWDLDNNGSFEAAGASVTFSAAGLDGPAIRMVRVRVEDGQGHQTIATATIEVQNVAPSVAAGPDASLIEGGALDRPGTWSDPGADGWTATVDYGDQSGVQPLELDPNGTFRLVRSYQAAGDYLVAVAITDDDGGVGTATFTVHVTAAPPGDVIGPRVVSVSRTGIQPAPTVLRVTFDEDLDPARARDPGQYALYQPGKDGKFGTRDDRRIRIKLVAYDAATRTVLLTPARRLGLGERVQLVINGSRYPAVTDLAGNRLDGDGDGQPGRDFTTTIRGFASGPGQGKDLRSLDLNGDGIVNAEDWHLLRNQEPKAPMSLLRTLWKFASRQ